jgi:hypothetical protein
MATTTNYSWVTPDDTSLVKDGASAIRTLGSSVDTTVKALNPGTTSGDLDYYTSATTKVRLAKGTASQVLAMNSGATAPEWTTIAAGAYTSLASGTLSSNTLTISSISSAYTDLILNVTNIDLSGDGDILVRLNGVTSTSYAYIILRTGSATSNINANDSSFSTSTTQFGGAYNTGAVRVELSDYKNTTSMKIANIKTSFLNGAGTKAASFTQGAFNSSSAISSITIYTDAVSWTGSYQLLGVK